MNRFQFTQNKIRICALIVGGILGILVFHYLWTDFSYVEDYFSYTILNRNVVSVELKQLILFIMYYELKKIIFLNFICITKYRKILIPSFFVYVGVKITIQICMVIYMFQIGVLGAIFINVIESLIQLLFIYLAEKYITKIEYVLEEVWKYRMIVFAHLLFISVIIVGGISVVFALILKYFFL